jgi:hypothetical protein
LGQLYKSDKLAFRKAVDEQLSPFWLARQQRWKDKARIIVMSDRMSGDSRLVGLYASYRLYPILYFVTEAKLGKADSTAQYLTDLGVTLVPCAVEDSHGAYDKFENTDLPNTFKATSVTEFISDLLQKRKAETYAGLPNREDLIQHIRQYLHEDTVPESAAPLLKEGRSVLVVWTKAKAVPSLFSGRPEHLLGNSGLLQILTLAKELNVATAVGGDMQLKPEAAKLVDYDLRFIDNGLLKGYSLKQQYGILQRINIYLPLVHLGMRSGQIEPLALLGMKTIYLEELGSKQGDRMQQLQTATDEFYSRAQFNLPPTLKGRLREAINYYFDYKLQVSLKGTPAATPLEEILGMLRTLAKKEQPPKGTEQEFKAYMYEMQTEMEGRFKELKVENPQLKEERGFTPEDLATLRGAIEQLYVGACISKAVNMVRALQTELTI